MSEIEQTAVQVVARTLGGTRHPLPLAFALLRIVGNAIARMKNHEAAAEAHLAQFHHHHKLSRKGQV